MNEQLGKQKVWGIETNNEGKMKIAREDGKFFEIDMIMKGYDRPIILNYGIGVVSIVFVDGEVATEPETIITDVDCTKLLHQNRVLRASADNPNYIGIPKGTKVGENYFDSQRIIHRDGLPQSIVSVSNKTVQRKVKEKKEDGSFEEKVYDCKLVSLKDYQKTVDGPGKVALFDAMATFLTDTELTNIVKKISERIIIDNMLGSYNAEKK